MYILPNLITTGSLFCGILALVRIFEGKEGSREQACWLILFAAVLDVFDGLIARLTRTESKFGLHYDSLSDLIAFGVSPAALMLSFLRGPGSHYVTPPCILYIICGALRLARFNVQAMGEESRSVTGLPIPAAAGTLVSAYLTFRDASGNMALQSLPFLIFVLAGLMVSKAPYPSLKSMSMTHRKPFDWLVLVALVAGLVAALNAIEPILLTGFLAYIGWGIARYFIIHSRKGSLQPATPAPGAPPESLRSGEPLARPPTA